jgi:hypothetical protein
MVKSILGEFTMILALLEILIPHLGLLLFVGSLGLFWTQVCVEESLHDFLLYLF